MNDGGIGAAVREHAPQSWSEVGNAPAAACKQCVEARASGCGACIPCGDRLRIGAAFESLRQPLQATLAREVGRSLAEEIVQEVFLRTIARARGQGIRSLELNYMLKCASRLARRARRGERNRQLREEECGRRRLHSSGHRRDADPSGRLARQDQARDIGHALDALPERRQTALRMLLAERRSHREVSMATGVAETTLVNWRHRFVGAMRRVHACRD